MKKITLAAAGLLGFLSIGSAEVTCSNSSFVGTYGFVGARSPFTGVSIAPPGTVARRIAPITELVQGTRGANPFSAVGTVYSDGAGTLYATRNNIVFDVVVGTYSLGSDCRISITLDDVLSPPPSDTTTTAVTPRATFQGFLVDNGNEADLLQTGGPGPVVVTMKRTLSNNSCTTANLAGRFTFVTQGSLAPTGGEAATGSTNFGLLGSMIADAGGNFIVPAPGPAAGAAATGAASVRDLFTGSYSVNPDCTGRGRLVAANGQVREIDFVLVNPSSACTNQPLAPAEILFDFSTRGTFGFGSARAQ